MSNVDRTYATPMETDLQWPTAGLQSGSELFIAEMTLKGMLKGLAIFFQCRVGASGSVRIRCT